MKTLRDVLRSAGPCITIVMPPYHPGEPANSSVALLKRYLQKSRQQLNSLLCPNEEIGALLRPLEDLSKDAALAFGSRVHRVLFRSPNSFEQFHLSGSLEESFTLGGSFAIRRLLRPLSLPRIYYILAVHKTGVDLLRQSGADTETVALPGVPNTLAEALALDVPDHDLENRAPAGGNPGAMRRVRFGTGAGHETEESHLSDYYKMVDRAIQDLLRKSGAPLVIAGVEKDTAVYRRISGYGRIVQPGINGSLDVRRELQELVRQAGEILFSASVETDAQTLKQTIMRMSSSRFSTDLKTVANAAAEGRISDLYLNESAHRISDFEVGSYRSLGEEDVLNFAAVQTILHDGRVCELPSGRMARQAEVIGILRF